MVIVRKLTPVSHHVVLLKLLILVRCVQLLKKEKIILFDKHETPQLSILRIRSGWFNQSK